MDNPFILSALGLTLIFLEFYVPGAVLGITGGILMLAAMILFASQDHSTIEVFLFVTLSLVAVAALIKFTLQRIKRAKPNHSIYLSTDQEGYVASSFDEALIGKIGIVSSDLRPAGNITIEDRQYQAPSQGEYLDKGTKVTVISGQGAYLIVQIYQSSP